MARLSNKFNPLLKTYPESEKINSVSEGAEVLYVRLLAASDDAGRYYGDAGWVLSKLFTARALAEQLDKHEVERRLCELESCKPTPLIKRYWVGSVRYLELINVMKCLRGDVSPQIIFPEQLTETGPDCPAVVPPTSTQPNHNPTSTSTSDVGGTDVGVDGKNSRDWDSFDWKSIQPDCQAMYERIVGKGHPLGTNDREEILKVQALLATSAIRSHWVDEAVAKARRRSTKKPFAAFHSTLGAICREHGLNLNQMFRGIAIPEKVLNPRRMQEATQC